MRLERDGSGGAYIWLSDGEIRDEVGLDELEAADRIAALESIVLHFDFYGRLAGIELPEAALHPDVVTQRPPER